MNRNDTANTIPKMRTFAADLTAKRASGGTTNSTPHSASPETTPPVKIKEKIEVIPPFHTFNNAHKEVGPSTKPPSTPVTTSEAQKIISRSSTVSQTTTEALPAVIITDTKRKRFSLTSALATSMSDWLEAKKAEVKKRKQPKYTVASAERRKGVIQKATAKTGRESSADHQAVLSRIKAAKQIPHTHNVEPEVPAPSVPVISKTPTWETSNQDVPKTTTPAVGLVTQKIQQAAERQPGIPVTASLINTPSTSTDFQPLPLANSFESQSKIAIPPPVVTLEPFVPFVAATPSPEPIVAVIPEPQEAVQEIQPTIPVYTTPTAPSARENMEPVAYPSVLKPEIEKIQPTIPVNRPPATLESAPVNTSNAQPVREVVTAITPVAPENIAPVAYPSVFNSEYIDTAASRLEKPTTERRFAPPAEPRRSFTDVFTQTNHLVFISFGVLLFVVITGLGLRSYLNNAPAAPTDAIITTELATTFETSAVAAVPYNVYSANDLFLELKNKRSVTDELFELTFINPLSNTVVSPSEFFSYVDAPVLFDFKETASAITFGGYRGTAWITISVLDTTTALGGMLQWESTMALDLVPIFENQNISTQYKFSDSILSGKDVRILKNRDGEEILVYGFINNSTIVITEDTSTFMILTTNFPTR